MRCDGCGERVDLDNLHPFKCVLLAREKAAGRRATDSDRDGEERWVASVSRTRLKQQANEERGRHVVSPVRGR